MRLNSGNAIVDRWADGVDRQVNELGVSVDQLDHTVSEQQATVDTVVADTAAAATVTSVSVIETGYTIDNSNYVDVAASYFAPNPLGNFGGVFLVVKNYHGSSELVKVGEHNFKGVASGGATFHVQLDRTFETVTFYFVAKNTVEATQDDWTTAPSTTVALNGTAFTAGLNLTAGGKNILQNPGFESNNVGTVVNTTVPVGSPITDGWFVLENVGSFFQPFWDTTPRSGAHELIIRLAPGVTIPNDSVQYDCRVYSGFIPVSTGDIIRISGWLNWSSNAVFPAGVTQINRISLLCYNNAGSLLGEVLSTANTAATNTGYNFVQGALTMPATVGGQNVSFVRFTCTGFVQNTSGSPLSTGASLYASLLFDDLKCVVQNTSFDISAVNTAYGANGSSPLTATTGGSANHATIAIAATTLQYGDGQVSYSSGSITPLNDTTKYYTYADDPTFSGGAVSYQATVNQADITGANGRVYFGSITTPAFGGGGTGGNGGGSSPCVTGNTQICLYGTTSRIADLFPTKVVKTLTGFNPIAEVLAHDYDGPMCDMGDGEYITPGHRVLRGDEWIPASDVWSTQVPFTGKVYNLHVENEHNYVLKNGAILHNYNKL